VLSIDMCWLSSERPALLWTTRGGMSLVLVHRSRPMRFSVSQRLLLLPSLLAAIAVPVAPALAGENPGDSGSNAPTLHASQGCVAVHRTKAAVSGSNIATVAFYVDGKLVKTVTQANANGRSVFSMSC